jgi:hypothetical protein
VRVGDLSYTGTLEVSFNSITGTVSAVSNEDASAVVDASANYWGTSDPTAVQARITGAGAANVDFTPLLDNDEALADKSVVGFQPDTGSVTVHTLGSQVGSVGRIQEGINLVDSGGTVNVLTGAYTGGADATSNSVTLAAGSSPGLVTLTGDLTLDADDTFAADVNGGTPGTGFDQWVVTGAVTLGGAILSATGTKTSQPGAVLVLIQNDGTDAASGTFFNQAELSTVVINGVTYRISYAYNAEAGTFGDGNDVALIQTPVLGGTKTSAITDKQTAAPFDTFTIFDAPTATQTVSVQINHLNNGTFTAASLASSGFVSAGNGKFTFTGTTADVQAAVRMLVYRPTENQVAPGTVLHNTFTVTVNNGFTTAVKQGTVVEVTSVNDGPVLSGAQAHTISDTETVKPFGTFGITDPDRPHQPLTVSVQQNHLFNGSFTSASLASSGFVSQGNGLYTFMGTAAQAQAAIRKLVWVPVDRNPPASVRTTFTVTASDGIAPPSRNTGTSVLVNS